MTGGDHWLNQRTVHVLAGDGVASLPAAPARDTITCRDHIPASPAGELQVFPGTPHPLDRVSMTMLAQAIAQFSGG
jgi:hypothetical protein